MLYEIICWNVANGFSYLFALGPGPHFYGASRYAPKWGTEKWGNRGLEELNWKGKLLRVISWKAFTSILVAKTLRHISCLPPSSFPLLLLSFSLFLLKDQIRSSVKIARQRFACQGISFWYLYWNLIRLTYAFPFRWAVLQICCDSFSISTDLANAKSECDSNRFHAILARDKTQLMLASSRCIRLILNTHTQVTYTHTHQYTHTLI